MPIIPRIQRLFRCKELTMLQGWHASQISEQGVMRILAHLIAMKHIEDTWPKKFKDEEQSLRLSIDMDGVNPYSLQNTSYSICPIVVIKNNIPPWLSMKNEHLMLYLIVLGRRQVKNMDVYVQPLIDELKELWEGIHVYDVSRPIATERSFTLYDICAYTTPDYLGLGVCSGKLHVYLFVYICNNIVSHINLIHCNCFDLHDH